ncbi:MAG: DsbA family protein [Rhizobiaceae bacterium]|nr:DsbA family protein [Rhizobiaceae bacterium]
MTRTDVRLDTSKRFGTKAATLFGTACLLVLAGCSGEESGTASSGVVTSATAQETPAPSAAPATTAPAPAAAAVEAPAAQGTVDVAELMKPGALPDVVMGDPNAPVTIVEYASMTCGHCATFHIQTLPTIKANYIDTGKAKLIMREFPFDPRALAAFMLARCAPEDKRTAMVDVLFRQQDQWARAQNASEALFNISKLAGFTQESFAACLNDKDLQTKIVETQERGEKEFGVAATPTLFVNGNRYSGAMGAPELSAVIESML